MYYQVKHQLINLVICPQLYDLNPALTLYGGSNQESNSGIMRFVRIEFAGKKSKGSSPLNAYACRCW
jgi:hypothetical protein